MSIERKLNIKNFYLTNKKNTENKMGILNRKANEKLNFVINIYEKALKGHWKTEHDGFLCKKISFNNLYYLKELKMSYFLKDRFFARNYDLVLEYEVPAFFNEQMKFGLCYSGVMKISGAQFVMINGDREAVPVLKKLNNPLILSRLVKLELLALNLEYSPQKEKWYVRADSLIGSATWNLIPPMLQVIKPKEKECVLMIELFELIADALRNDESYL